MARERELHVFISYRRDDAAPSARLLFDWLVRQFGRDHVFLDTEKIASGDEFARVLDARLAASDVLLAVIGPRWIAVEDARGRRLDQPDDFVRREIEAALARNVRVVPVLVAGAKMPRAEELPPSLAALAGRNAATIDETKFERDFDLLVDDLLGRPRGFVRRELDRVQRLVRVAKWTLVLVPLLAAACAIAVWTHVLDVFTLDSRVAGLLLHAGDALSSAPTPTVTIAAIDAATEERLGRKLDASAEWRRHHARLIERAAAAGAAAIAFDLFFERDSPADGELARAAVEAREGASRTRVVFGFRALGDDGSPRIAAALRAQVTGSVCLFERLGLWQAPLAVIGPPRAGRDDDEAERPAHTPALALAVAAGPAIRGVDLARRRIELEGHETPSVRYSAVERIRSRPEACEVYGTETDVAKLFIRPSPPGYWRDAARWISYERLLDGALPEGLLRGKTVLVGALHPRDERDVRRGLGTGAVYGVELHADAVANLLGRRIVTTPTVGEQAWLTVAMVVAGAAASVWGATLSRRARRGAVGAAIAAYVLVAVGLAAAGHLLNAHYDVATFLASRLLLDRLQSRPLRPGAGEIPA